MTENTTSRKPTGRPSSFTQDVADAICGRIAMGESLRRICLDDAMPDAKTVFRWLRQNDEFSQQYAQAREDQADGYADEITEIADEVNLEDVLDKDGNVVEVKVDATAVARNRLRVDARKWVASKLRPKKYGDRVDHNHAGKLTLESLVAGSYEKPNPPKEGDAP